MRISIISLGSRGDVQPYVSLAVGLQASGHEVRLLAEATYEALARDHGLGFRAVAGDARALVQSPAVRSSLQDATYVQFWRALSRAAAATARQRLTDCWRGCQDAQALVVSPLALAPAYAVAQRLGVPVVRAFYAPFTATGDYPSSLLPPNVRLGRTLNRCSHFLAAHLSWLSFRSQVNAVRRAVLDLPPLGVWRPYAEMDRRRWPVLNGYSTAVCPRPSDWPHWVHVTGYWCMNLVQAWEPPRELLAFLDAGPPPVYVGFGSMAHGAADDTTSLVASALARANLRGVLATGWGGLGHVGVPGHVHFIGDAPHDWLFAHMRAVVHHGGAGTTGAALRAGVPSVVVPFGFDQRFWGERVFRLGVGPRPIPRSHLSAERLADALTTISRDDRLRERAAELGRRIRAEDGVARAVEVFETVFAHGLEQHTPRADVGIG